MDASVFRPDIQVGQNGSMTAMPPILKKRSEFLAVQRGEKRRGRYFLLEVLRDGREGPPRVGITVTRRQGNAVERNRIRRRLRAAIRGEPGRHMEPGSDYVIVARREVLQAPFDALQAELSRRISSRPRQ